MGGEKMRGRRENEREESRERRAERGGGELRETRTKEKNLARYFCLPKSPQVRQKTQTSMDLVADWRTLSNLK